MDLLLAFMKELDEKHDGNWGSLPIDHPDIVKARKLNPYSVEPRIEKVWTTEMEDFIRENYQTMSDEEMGKALNYGKSTIEIKRRELGLKRKRGEKPVQMTDLNGTIIRYETTKEAAEAQGVSQPTMRKWLDRGTNFGRKWEYADSGN